MSETIAVLPNDDVPEEIAKAFKEGRIIFFAWAEEETNQVKAMVNSTFCPERLQQQCCDKVVEVLGEYMKFKLEEPENKPS